MSNHANVNAVDGGINETPLRLTNTQSQFGQRNTELVWIRREYSPWAKYTMSFQLNGYYS